MGLQQQNQINSHIHRRFATPREYRLFNVAEVKQAAPNKIKKIKSPAEKFGIQGRSLLSSSEGNLSTKQKSEFQK